jgi:glycosyltransferase involved in cell wall biosynthesis
MLKVMMVLPNFHGVTGDAINERRIALSIARHERVAKVYVFTLAGISQIRGPKANIHDGKLSVFTLPRAPSPFQLLFLLQLIAYGFFFATICVFLRAGRFVNTVYARDTFLAYALVLSRSVSGPVAVKIVAMTTREILSRQSGVVLRDLTRRLGRAVETYVIRNADAIFTVPGSLRGELQRIRGHDTRIVELHQPVPVERLSQSPPLWPKESGYRVGYIGTVAPMHSVDVIVKAMGIVQRTVHDARLLIIGDGDPRDLSHVSELMRASGVTGSIILRIPEEAMPGVYRSLDVVLIPRSDLLGDVVPLKFVEAVVAKVPVILTRCESIRRLLSGSGVEDITLIEHNDPQDWADGIRRMVMDKELRVRVSNTLFQYLEPYLQLHTGEMAAARFVNTAEQLMGLRTSGHN